MTNAKIVAAAREVLAFADTSPFCYAAARARLLKIGEVFDYIRTVDDIALDALKDACQRIVEDFGEVEP